MKKILPADLPGIDVESALTRLGDEEELLADLIVSFREDNLTTIDDIRHALETNDQDLARRLVHTLKGVSGNIGAEPLYGTSKKLEIAIKEQNKPAVDTLLEIAKKEIEEYVLSLQTCCKPHRETKLLRYPKHHPTARSWLQSSVNLEIC